MSSFPFPFLARQVEVPGPAASALFERQFGGPPPADGIHYVAMREARAGGVSAYTHYYEHEPGVFLCGGLCVDSRDYRRLTREQRLAVAEAGSLSRWLSVVSIADLPAKRAVFAFTGDSRSRRDAFAIGFELAVEPHLLVQWHAEPPASRAALIERIHRLGPF